MSLVRSSRKNTAHGSPQANASGLHLVAAFAPDMSRPFQMAPHDRDGSSFVLLRQGIEQLKMLACRLRDVFAARTALEALKPDAIAQRLHQVGEGLVAKRGDQAHMKRAVGLEKLDQIAGIGSAFGRRRKLAQ